MSKVKVSFDPDNWINSDTNIRIWDYSEFREFIKSIFAEDSIFDLYLITTSTDSDYITSIQNQIGLDSSKVITVSDNTTKLTQIGNLDIQIHLDGNHPTVVDVEGLDIVGIMVNYLCDNNRRLKWIGQFEFWYNILTDKNIEIV